MNFTDLQFDVLVELERIQDKNESLELHQYTTEQIKQAILELKQLELIDENQLVTLKGYRWLEPHRVKKAIFMAAGFGSRMVPLTFNTPKPLIKVNGRRIIDTLLDAVLAAGITDITICRGYLADNFDLLLKKYPMIKFVENPTYNEANNIGSALLIKDLMEDAYVLESDLVLYNPKRIRKYELHSNYMGKKVDQTDDWCFDVKDGVIQAVNVGGKDCYHMYGISFWKKEDAKKMQEDIPALYYSDGGKQKYWDEVSLRYFKDHYNIHVREVFEGDIIEIDTFNELKEIDSMYNV